MHVVQLLHKYLKRSCVGVHAKRLNALITLVMGLALGGKLSITGIGRSLKTNAKTKNKIKQADRLIGNTKLHAERKLFYTFAAKMIVGFKKKPLVIVDWSSLPNINYYLLRASIPTQGRSLTVYEEVHSVKKLTNHKVHKAFLKSLSKILPPQCKPLIITDAGFYSPFFREVEKLGWDFLGRVRNLTKYKLLMSQTWFSYKELFKKATKVPDFIGEVILSRSTPTRCFLFVYKGKKMGRIAKNKFGERRQNKASKQCANGNREPWILATSLCEGKKIAKKVVRAYKTRMQIEESFRDIKNSRFGFGFRESKTYQPKRFEILLLIGMLAILAITILGKTGEIRKLQYEFQANTIRNRTVLSLFFLGCQLIRDPYIKFSQKELLLGMAALISSLNGFEDISV